MTLFDLHNPEASADLPAMSAHARATDPQTSHDAARSLAPVPLERVRDRICDILAHKGTLTHHGIINAYRKWYGDVPESTVRTRVSELRQMGRVVDSGQRLVIDSGRAAILWELVK